LPSIKKDNTVIDELASGNIPKAAALCIKQYNQCMTVESGKPVVLTAKVLEGLELLGHFDLNDLSQE
jgi:hypothetical protein